MEISVTRGLTELKMLTKRIEREIRDSVFISYKIGKNPVKNFSSQDEFENEVQKNYQSVTDLIRRRKRIKTAIVQSNAITVVTIGGDQMSVADAIERKTSIEVERSLLEKMRRDFDGASRAVDRENEKMNDKIDALLNKNAAKEAKVKEEDYEMISKPYIEAYKAELVDPMRIRDKIDALQKEIEDFESEVDFVLSESNAITTIEVPDH